MWKILAILLITVGTNPCSSVAQQASPNGLPPEHVPKNYLPHAPKESQQLSDAKTDISQLSSSVKPSERHHADTEAAKDTDTVPNNPSQGWSLADEIALGACIFAGLQFGALIITIAIMIGNGRRQLRAYVVVERGIIANVADPPAGMPREKIDTVARILDPQTGPHAQITIKNTGQTPAYNLVHWALISIREFPLRTQFPSMPIPPASYWNVLGSGVPEVKTLRMSERLAPEQIEGLRNGTMAIYCHGEIRYKDAFKKSRTTRYRCMYVTPACGVIGIGTDLVYCEEGNEAD